MHRSARPLGAVSVLARLTLCSIALLLGACRSMYFDPAPAPEEPLQLSPGNLPQSEYWTGIVFNGEKVGFSRMRVQRQDDGWRIESRAAMRFRLLGFDKEIVLQAIDHVGPELELRRFEYRYDLDGSIMQVQGTADAAGIRYETMSAGQRLSHSEALQGPVWPTSVIHLRPLQLGLQLQRDFRYRVFDGETQTVSEIKQRVAAYERSDLFHGQAWRLESRLHGHRVSTWINDQGLPQLELSLGGAVIAHLEPADRARDYLLQAALNKSEALLALSLVPMDGQLTGARTQQHRLLRVEGLPAGFIPASGSGQRCTQGPRGSWDCWLMPSWIDPGDSYHHGHREPSLAVPSRSPEISQLAASIRADAEERELDIALLNWVHRNINAEAADSFSALDVLRNRRGECQGQSMLLAALLRNEGQPARLVNGLVYSEDLQGFAWHTWVETWKGNRWISMDPIFGQSPVDSSHLRLLEGESPRDLLPMLELIGRLQLRQLEVADS